MKGFVKLICNLCEKDFTSVADITNIDTLKYTGLLTNCKDWEQSGYLEKKEETTQINSKRLKFQIGANGIENVVEITLILFDALEKLLNRLSDQHINQILQAISNLINSLNSIIVT